MPPKKIDSINHCEQAIGELGDKLHFGKVKPVLRNRLGFFEPCSFCGKKLKLLSYSQESTLKLQICKGVRREVLIGSGRTLNIRCAVIVESSHFLFYCSACGGCYSLCFSRFPYLDDINEGDFKILEPSNPGRGFELDTSTITIGDEEISCLEVICDGESFDPTGRVFIVTKEEGESDNG